LLGIKTFVIYISWWFGDNSCYDQHRLLFTTIVCILHH
jgi:hypothetical protein